MKGFYFGGSIIDEESLRASVLYYDYIIHYDVRKFFSAYYGRFDTVTNAINRFENFTKLYRDEQLLKLIPISGWIDKYDTLLTGLAHQQRSDFFDEDEEFKDIVNSYDAKRLIILRNLSKTQWVIPPEEAVPERDYFAHFAQNNAFLDMPSVENLSISEYWDSVALAIGREVSYGLLGSIEYQACPFTDSQLFSRELNRILKRLAAVDQFGISRRRFNRYSFFIGRARNQNEGDLLDAIFQMKWKYNLQIVKEALKLKIPAFASIPNEELLEFIGKRKSVLQEFRNEIDHVVDEIEMSGISSKNERDIELLIRTKLRKKIESLEKVITEHANKAKQKRIENITLTTINLTAFAYLPFEAVILPAVLSLGKWTTDEISNIFEISQRQKNGLHLLLELEKQRI